MFTGIGGFELGLEKSNIEHELIGYSEIDLYAIKIFEKHFPGYKTLGNAVTVNVVTALINKMFKGSEYDRSR